MILKKKVQKSLVREKEGCFLYCLLSTAADGTTSRLALGDKVEFKDGCSFILVFVLETTLLLAAAGEDRTKAFPISFLGVVAVTDDGEITCC